MDNGKTFIPVASKVKAEEFPLHSPNVMLHYGNRQNTVQSIYYGERCIITEDLDCLQSAFSLKMRLVLISSSA